ncbi:nudix (nucleoside diphosphate linked moiety X)-type motif 22 [Chamberlinius hualienensis]
MEADYTAFSPDSNGLTKDKVRVEFLPKLYNRQKDDETEKQIELTWQKRLAENPKIFDGSKFRLHGIKWADTVAETTSIKVPTLCLGLTSYKKYLGTNCSDQKELLYQKGQQNCNNPQAYMSDALGVGTFLIASDEKFVFLKRSQFCSEAQGLIDGPGGHSEPDMIEGIFTKSPDQISSELIVEELFDSIIREVIDEVNIPRKYLQEPTLLGVTTNYTTGGRKSAEFLIRCSLPSAEVAHLFSKGTQPEADESTAILFKTLNELFVASDHPNHSSWLEFAPATRARILMYKYLHNNVIS